MIKDKKGITPLVATVFMVAVTVILAGVLFAIVVSLDDTEESEYRCPHCGNQYTKSEMIRVVMGTGTVVYYCPHCNAEGLQVIVTTR